MIDRGSGIDPKHLETIFNPFFTTKPDGVGLGLAIVSKIVDEHGGKITVESEPGKGSVFRVLLPMARQCQPSGQSHEKRILVVEDEDKLRRVIELQLTSAGFDVDKAATAEDALKLARPRRPGPHRSATARHGRPGAAGRNPPPEFAHAGDRDDGVRQRGNRRGSHEGRRHRFSAQAVFARSPDAGGPEGARSARPCATKTAQLKEELGRRYEFDNIIGRSPAMQEIFATIERVAPTRATVLLAAKAAWART